MKIVFALFLLVIISLPFIELVEIKIEIKALKKQVKTSLLDKLRAEETTCLKFSKLELKKILDLKFYAEEREIEFKHRIYDIINEYETKDSIIYICYFDAKETSLRKKLYNQLERIFHNHPTKSKQADQLIVFLKNLYYEDIERFSSNLPSVTNSSQKFSYLDFVQPSSPAIQTPPPEQSFL